MYKRQPQVVPHSPVEYPSWTQDTTPNIYYTGVTDPTPGSGLHHYEYAVDKIPPTEHATPVYKGSLGMNWRSRGSGYNIKYNEFWFPQYNSRWLQIYRYDGTTHNYLGSFSRSRQGWAGYRRPWDWEFDDNYLYGIHNARSYRGGWTIFRWRYGRYWIDVNARNTNEPDMRAMAIDDNYLYLLQWQAGG